MQCQQFDQILEQQAGETLPREAEAHLNDCARCRTVVQDLEAIQLVASELAAEVAEPPERVWLTVRRHLGSEGLIRTPHRTGRPEGWTLVLPRPVLAGAYLAVAIAAAVFIGSRGFSPPQTAGLPESAPLTSSLATELNTMERGTVASLHQHNPAVVTSLRQNLDLVDKFISSCEKSVREQPGNELAREYLYGAYQQKAELLAMMMDRNATGD